MSIDGKASAPEAADATLRLEIPPDARFSRPVRERIAAFTRAHQIPAREAGELIMAVAEAVANAVEHARSGGTIEVTCMLAGERLIATVVDHGVGFVVGDALEPRAPEPHAERGRGLPIMRECTDLLSIRSVPGRGTSVLLGRNVSGIEDESRQLAS